MDGRKFLSDNIGWIKDLAGRACGGRLDSDDRQEFQSFVLLKLVENDYSILRGFRGDASIKTYLHRVVHRLWLDYLVAKNGKWRPSAASRRLGGVAVELERLIYRDGLPLSEAVALLRHRKASGESTGRFLSLAAKLPVRPRRSFVPADGLEPLVARGGSPEENWKRRDRAHRRRELQKVLYDVFHGLDAMDRWLLRKRFKEQRTVAEIARGFGADPKKLYRRFDRMLKKLREALQECGVQLEEVTEIFGGATGELQIPLTLSSQSGFDLN